jgi:hypothetical protein
MAEGISYLSRVNLGEWELPGQARLATNSRGRSSNNSLRPSPDGKKLGLILEAPTSEAVLLHDVR